MSTFKTLGIIGVAALVFFSVWIFRSPSDFPQLTESAKDIIEEVRTEVFAPPPLRAEKKDVEAILSRKGVIEFTNKERQVIGEAPLRENSELNAAAEVKVNDMFAKQYFAHVSPSGHSAGDLAHEAGYVSIAIGENLALGNFEGDEALVEAWMNSPGHRANILRGSFEEIGVAVKKGTYEGETTWLAVQIFGRPRSSCPETDKNLALEIDAKKAKEKELTIEIQQKKEEIDATRGQDRRLYNQRVDEYNELVRRYNILVGELKAMVESYNATVKIANACIQESS